MFGDGDDVDGSSRVVVRSDFLCKDLNRLIKQGLLGNWFEEMRILIAHDDAVKRVVGTASRHKDSSDPCGIGVQERELPLMHYGMNGDQY